MNATPFLRGYSARLTMAGIAGFAILLALAAQVAVPIPGTPVPATLTPMIVVLAGLMLGAQAGAASMLLYLALGAIGLPVFAPMGAPGIARLLGPTGGYLIAYPAAAWIAGTLARRLETRGLIGRWAAALAGMAVIFLGGIGQLAVLTGGIGRAVVLGVTPFALLDVAKALAAAAVAGRRARVQG